MKIVIEIKDDNIKLILKDSENVVDESSWKEEQNLSKKLLPEIDKLIKNNKLETSDIDNVEVDTGISEKFTTVRIAKIVAKTFNFVNKK